MYSKATELAEGGTGPHPSPRTVGSSCLAKDSWGSKAWGVGTCSELEPRCQLPTPAPGKDGRG